mmetsp:Transcript_23049/g.48317  ORF Transcript_23049/g.48317 Transcript_23049/m.48317 type:complete len:157 (-) Transcript_23049:668-1138(-)
MHLQNLFVHKVFTAKKPLCGRSRAVCRTELICTVFRTYVIAPLIKQNGVQQLVNCAPLDKAVLYLAIPLTIHTRSRRICAHLITSVLRDGFQVYALMELSQIGTAACYRWITIVHLAHPVSGVHREEFKAFVLQVTYVAEDLGAQSRETDRAQARV